MQPKSFLLLHIALLPLYITLALYFDLVPQPLTANLSVLLRLAKANALKQRQRILSVPLSTTTSAAALRSKSDLEGDMTAIKFVPRRSEERGQADHGWLKTFHTFSFAMYQDHKHEQFGPLRVINEDRVAPRTGFGTHSHREFEIFSYVVSGELEHKDSMGNTEILKRGSLQMTSAGTGISHSEKAHGTKPVHFLQIWALPHTPRLQPQYFTRSFTDAEKRDTWVRIVAPAGGEGVSPDREAPGPAPVHSALTLYATILGEGGRLEKGVEGKKGYVHVVQTSKYNPGKADGASVRVSGGGEELELREGDGVYMNVQTKGQKLVVENVGSGAAEVLFFDME